MIHIPKKADVFRLKVTKQKLEQEQERIDNFAYDIISSQIEEDTLKKKYIIIINYKKHLHLILLYIYVLFFDVLTCLLYHTFHYT